MGEVSIETSLDEDFDIVTIRTPNGKARDIQEYIANGENGHSPGQQEILCMRELDMEADVDEEKSGDPEPQELINDKIYSLAKSATKSPMEESQLSIPTVSQPLAHANERKYSGGNQSHGTPPSSSGGKVGEKSSSVSRNMLKKSTSLTDGRRNTLGSENSLHNQDFDARSVTSTATTARANKFKLTVPVAPTFRSGERAEKRKEYYLKLSEKQKALEEEKRQAEARKKEEQDAVIREMRKSLVIRANPVPSFYHDKTPPKVELKKVPSTRAKSPKLTRRKSCNDSPFPPLLDSDGICRRCKRFSMGAASEASGGTGASCCARSRVVNVAIRT